MGPGLEVLTTFRFLVALTIWSFYVVVGRVCAPAIQGRSSQGYSVGAGGEYRCSKRTRDELMVDAVGTMIGFVILWLMFSWSYMKVSTPRET